MCQDRANLWARRWLLWLGLIVGWLILHPRPLDIPTTIDGLQWSWAIAMAASIISALTLRRRWYTLFLAAAFTYGFGRSWDAIDYGLYQPVGIWLVVISLGGFLWADEDVWLKEGWRDKR